MRTFLILLSTLLFSISSSYAVGYKTIGGVEYVVDTLEHYKVGPGTTYTRINFINKKSPLRAYIYEVELNNPHVKIKAETSTGLMTGMEQISSIAKRKSTEGNLYFAGVNGDFYNTQTGEPVHGFMTDGVMGNIPYATAPAFGVGPGNMPYIDALKFTGSLKVGETTHAINRTNSSRGANLLVMYNLLQGASTKTNIYGTEVLVELVEGDWLLNGGVKRIKVKKKEVGVGNMSIDNNCVVFSGNGTAQAFLDLLNVDDVIDLNMDLILDANPSLTHGITECVGGDRWMLRGGALYGENWSDRHPRTGAGFNSDKSKAYFIVVDGRSSHSAGATTHAVGEIMLMAGVSDALNLDGGGSSGMYLQKYGIVNIGSDGSERRVSNGLFAVSSAPSDNNVTSIGFRKSRYEVPIYSTMNPTIVGYNQYGHLVETSIAATLSCPAVLGSTDPSVGFIAGGSEQTDKLTATYNGMSVQVPVSVLNDGIVSITRDSILLDTKRLYLIDVKSFLNQNEFSIDPKALNWTVVNPAICVEEAGVLRGLSAGRTLVIGEFKGVEDTLLVVVEPVFENPHIQTNFQDVENFSIGTSSSNLTNLSLSSDNLPEGWTHGGRLNFNYTKGRYSEIRMVYTPKLYSIPDSIELTLNTGNSTVSKIILALSANNQLTTKAIDFKSIETNKDVVCGYNLKNTFPEDHLFYYPINLLSIGLELQDSKHTIGTEYNIYLKDVKLFYSDYTIGIDELISESGKLFIYPNPVKNGEAILNFETENTSPFRVDIYTLSGKLCKVQEFGAADSGQYALPVQDLGKGIYLVSVSQKGGFTESVKMIVN